MSLGNESKMLELFTFKDTCGGYRCCSVASIETAKNIIRDFMEIHPDGAWALDDDSIPVMASFFVGSDEWLKSKN